jgi:hypothetical protein
MSIFCNFSFTLEPGEGLFQKVLFYVRLVYNIFNSGNTREEGGENNNSGTR